MKKQAAKKEQANLTSTVTPEKIVAAKPVKPVSSSVVAKVVAPPKVKKPTRYSPELVPMKKLPTVYPAWVKEALAVPFDGDTAKFSYLWMYLLTRDLIPDYQNTTIDTIVNTLVAWAIAHTDTPVGKVLKDMSKTRLRDVRSRLEWVIVDVLYRYDSWLAAQPKIAEPVQELSAKADTNV